MKEIKTSAAIEILLGILLILIAASPLLDMAYGQYLGWRHPQAVVTADTEPPEPYLVWFVPLGPYRGGYTDAWVISADASAPTVLPESTQGDLVVEVWDPLESSGIKSISLASDGTDQTLAYWKTETTQTHKVYYYYHNAWTSPSSGSITFTVTVTDNAENSMTKKFYAVVGQPDGQFYINNQLVSADTHIYLNSLDLNFKFKATKVGSAIGSVLVEVYYPYPYGEQIARFFLNETTPDQEWTGNYTLPHTGTFEIRGYFYVQGHPYQRMSLVTEYQPWLTPTMTIRIILVFIGLALIGHGGYRAWLK